MKGLSKTKGAAQHTSCLKVILAADTEVMTSALMQDHMLVTCQAQSNDVDTDRVL